jgi:hypothetical protein
VTLDRWLSSSSPTAIHGWPFLCHLMRLIFRNCFKVAK